MFCFNFINIVYYECMYVCTVCNISAAFWAQTFATRLIGWRTPFLYWEQQKLMFPNVYRLAVWFLYTLTSSVPCERVCSKAREIISKKRNRLEPTTVEQILFLYKNEYSFPTNQLHKHRHCPSLFTSTFTFLFVVNTATVIII